MIKCVNNVIIKSATNESITEDVREPIFNKIFNLIKKVYNSQTKIKITIIWLCLATGIGYYLINVCFYIKNIREKTISKIELDEIIDKIGKSTLYNTQIIEKYSNKDNINAFKQIIRNSYEDYITFVSNRDICKENAYEICYVRYR